MQVAHSQTKPILTKTNDSWQLSKLDKLWRQSAFFKWQLRGQPGEWPSVKLIDPWQGNAMRGSQYVQGGLSKMLKDEAYHNFGWLRDIRDYGGAAGRILARDHITKWCQKHTRWHERRYRPDHLGTRLSHLCFTLQWVGDSASDEFQQTLLRTLSFQTNILARDWQKLHDQHAQIKALRGLFIAQAMLGQNERDLPFLLEIIISKARACLYPDWGIRLRSPEAHLDLLRLLIEVKQASFILDMPPSDDLDIMIIHMANLCKLWRHNNGQFAHFQGGGESHATHIDEVLKRTGAKGKITPQAPHTGFLRLTAARNTIIMDAGTPEPNAEFPAASTLAFEFSVGQSRFIVGAGQYSPDKRLASALCRTAAHSALSLDNADSSDISQNRLAQVQNVEAGPAVGGMLAVGSHDGYSQSHGIIHHRQVYLTSDGHNLRGADRLEYTGAPGEIPSYAFIRFHLHPRVSAAMLGDERILLKIHGQKAGWIFKSTGGSARLEQSLYLDEGRRSSCQQIVLSVPCSSIRTIGEIEAKWAFIRSAP